MKYNPQLHYRRSIRLRGYDYREMGAYFVTLVCQDREWLFGKTADGNMQSNELGQIVARVRMQLPDHFRNIALDQFVVMPNHVHGIIAVVHEPDKWSEGPRNADGDGETRGRGQRGGVDGDGPRGRGEALADACSNREISANANASPQRTSSPGASLRGTRPRSLNAVLRNFKSITTRQIHKVAVRAERPVWQRDYDGHIIRDDSDRVRHRVYIRSNPANWNEDEENQFRASVKLHP